MALELSHTVDPVSAEAFEGAMSRFDIAPGARIAVGVSGGADSMGLALLLAGWAASRNVEVHALTVDHRLRKGAAAEAAQVAAWLNDKNIRHDVLQWTEGIHLRGADSSPQSAARDARYRLMLDWCKSNDCRYLLIAHHADDQVETFLMRLARGSGVDGLAAIQPITERDGVQILRPLLDFSKAQLIEVCRAHQQSWVEDPSNESDKSTRVRFRKARAVLESEGLTRERLLSTARHMQRAKDAIDSAVAQFLENKCVLDEYGVARVPVDALSQVPNEVGLRALSRVLSYTSGSDYGPRFSSLENMYERALRKPWSDATLHGCVIVRDGTDLIFFREAARIADKFSIEVGHTKIWDGRFRVTLDTQSNDLKYREFTLSRLTPTAWREFQRQNSSSHLEDVPHRVRETLPAIFDSDGLAGIPHANYLRSDLESGLNVSISAVRVFRSSPPII